MSDGQDSVVRAAGGSVSADGASSAVTGGLSTLLPQDSAGAVVFASISAAAPPGNGNVQVNTGNNKVQVNLDGSGKVQVEI